MKVIISHNRAKRELVGSGFNICGSRKDLLRIAQQLQDEVGRTDFSFGWVSIRDEQEDEHCAGPNTPPQPWSS